MAHVAPPHWVLKLGCGPKLWLATLLCSLPFCVPDLERYFLVYALRQEGQQALVWSLVSGLIKKETSMAPIGAQAKAVMETPPGSPHEELGKGIIPGKFLTKVQQRHPFFALRSGVRAKRSCPKRFTKIHFQARCGGTLL